jgi:CRP-like cAMP-binding protein
MNYKNLSRAAHGVRCTTCQARCGSLWSDLPAEQVTQLDLLKICNVYQPGQVILYQGNPCLGVCCLASGAVAIRRADVQGNSMLLRLAHAGQLLGYGAFFSGGQHSSSAEALTECRVCTLDRTGLARLLRDNPELAHRFLGQLAMDLTRAEEARMQASLLPVRARLAQLLLMLRDQHATVDDLGVLHLDLPISRQDIASIIGTRPETVARTIRGLDADGVACFSGRHVTIHDLDALLDEVEQAA